MSGAARSMGRSMARRLAVGRAAMARQTARQTARRTVAAGSGTDAASGVAAGAAAVSRFGWGRGGYDATRRDIPETQDWNPGLGSPDADTLGALPRLRAMSRDAMRNMPLARGGVATVRDNVVGTGLWPEPSLDRDLLGLSDEAAEAWEARAKTLVLQHLTSTGIDAARKQNFIGLQSQALVNTFASGDIFALRRAIDRRDETLSTCYQLLEADRVATPMSALTNDAVRDGVEIDANGEPVAVHVVDQHPGDSPFTRALGAAAGAWGAAGLGVTKRFPVRTGDGRRWAPRLVLHVAELERPEQTRGVPALASVILLLKQLTRYTDSELAAAVLSSFFTVFVTRDSDGLGTAPLVPGSLSTSELQSGVTAGSADLRLGRGAIADLNPGESITIADPKRPNLAFDPFVQAILRQIGVALGLPFELLIKHFTASYSASRAALLEAWRSFKARQQWLVWSFCQPVYEAVLAELVARGKLNAPGFFTDETRRRAWCGAEWHGPVMGQLNPLDEANAAEKRIEIGLSSIAEETVGITGGSWERNHRQRAKEVKRRVADGLEPPVAAAAPRTPAASTAALRDQGNPLDAPNAPNAPNAPPAPNSEAA